MKAFLRRLFRLCGPVAIASLVGASVFLGPAPPVQADTGCWTAGSTLPQYGTPNIATGPLCDSSGHLLIAGSISSTTVFPYNGTNGQTLTSASFLGVGGLDANGHFSPLKQDASQNLDVNCITGCSGGGGSTTFPYTYTPAQAPTPASFLGVAGYNGTTIDPLLDVNGGQLRTTVYGATGNALAISAGGVASVTTPAPGPTAASGIPEQVLCDATTAGQCAKVSSTGYLNEQLVNSGGSGLSTGAPGDTVTNSPTGLFTIDYNLFFNGTTWTSARNTTAAGNNYAGTGLPASTAYGQYNTTLPTPSAGNYSALQTNANGVLYTVPTPSATAPAVQATPASSASSVTLLAAGAATNGWSICNNSTAILYISKTATATTGLYFIGLPAAATVPQCYIETNPGMYDGIVTGIWAAANGDALVTYW